MQHCPKYGLCNPDWVNRPGFSCNFWSAFSLANFLQRGLNCLVVASKRRLQLSTVELLITGNEQTFKNDRVMPNLRGAKKIYRPFGPIKLALFRLIFILIGFYRNYFLDGKGFLEIIDLLKINFTNNPFTFKKLHFTKIWKEWKITFLPNFSKAKSQYLFIYFFAVSCNVFNWNLS